MFGVNCIFASHVRMHDLLPHFEALGGAVSDGH